LNAAEEKKFKLKLKFIEAKELGTPQRFCQEEAIRHGDLESLPPFDLITET